jgi:Lar family restriction alleviation protein
MIKTKCGLKPCPFCGGQAVISKVNSGIFVYSNTFSYAKCIECGAKSAVTTSRDQTKKLWNERVKENDDK